MRGDGKHRCKVDVNVRAKDEWACTDPSLYKACYGYTINVPSLMAQRL